MKNKENLKPNILTFEKKSRELLNDEEILKLFMGFLRLMKKSALYDAELKCREKLNYYSNKLNETVLELNKRSQQVKELLEVNETLIRKDSCLLDKVDKVKSTL